MKLQEEENKLKFNLYSPSSVLIRNKELLGSDIQLSGIKKNKIENILENWINKLGI